MSNAIESIVRGYVLLKNREALEDLLAHRERLLDGLSRISGIDPNQLVTVIREEIAAVREGLDRLDGKATAAQEDDRVKVLRLTVSEGPPSLDNSASTPPPTADVPAVADQLVQLQSAGETDVELPEIEATRGPEPQNPQIRVMGLAVSVASTAPSPQSGVVGGLDPGAFALCPAPSNEPMQQLEENKAADTHSSAFEVFKSLASFWSKEPTKS
jgi:hypothetical protein